MEVEYENSDDLPKRLKKHQQPVYDPRLWWSANQDHKMESYKVSSRNLKAMGKHVTDLRKFFVERADKSNDLRMQALLEGLDDARVQGKKIRNRGSGDVASPYAIHPSEYKEDVPVNHRKRQRTKSKLSLSEKFSIVHQAVCQLRPLKSLAKEHRISESYVSLIVQKVRSHPKLLDELLAVEQEKEVVASQVSNAVIDMH